ncbi:integrase [Pseudomonas sp. BCA14]|uniref:integrase n=1 Tax=unclassified Pseudomonas TaxID=196821 RepID=UPI00106DE0F0|nr:MULTISPECIES: integrase [unclassified Pseudomonas]TFF03278.1 integrase [Pseudomonas sp. JMN1]TFF05260.1 integrase [Pseudomonas sp. BCA17]TFF20926.1 integrase [Pseudomonas sp. BCA14]TFF21251.1 integrase [Pseudomonas sp. BCA13]
MPDSVVVFTPRAERDATENLGEFIEMSRSQLAIFGAELCFDEMVWDVTDTAQLKGHGSKRVRIYFSTQETVDNIQPTQMAEPFVSFAKAYIRYMQGVRPTKNPSIRLTALRALDAAHRMSGRVDPVMMDGDTFNRAARLIAERFSGSTAYRAGSQLELIAKFMSEHRLTVVPLSWRSPIKRPLDSIRVGPEFHKRRSEKMPSQAALEALPKAFYLATEANDVLFSSIAAILCSAPDRINEVLLLAENCEVHDKTAGGRDAYGLRWQPAKGADPMVKWIIPSMAKVVAEAIAKIRIMTKGARRIAQWYELNPERLYLPQDLEHLRSQELLTMDEVKQVILLEEGATSFARLWCTANNVLLVKNGRTVCARFVDVEKAAIAQLPRGFPLLNSEMGLRFSEALIVVRRNELHSKRGTFGCVIEPVNTNQVNGALGAKVQHGGGSIFERFGFTEPDGSPIRVTTHQFRHYLNTLAQAGGMSQLDIAKWSGRVDVRQNEVYDHVSADQMVAKIRASIGDESHMFGPLANLPKNIPISRDEFARLKIPTAHTTDIGFCIHDYTMTPCDRHADCINCSEHVCVKGDEGKTMRVRHRLEDAKELLTRAEEATAQGYYGADRWMEHHKKTVLRLTQLTEIFDNPAVAIGSVIQLADVPIISSTGVEQALEDRAALDGYSTLKQLAPADASRIKRGKHG